MALKRTIKKTVYGIGIIGSACVVLLLILIPILRPRNVSTPTPTVSPFQAIEVQRVAVIPHGERFAIDRTVDVVAELRNPNPRAGVKEYTLQFSLQDAGGDEIVKVPATTYVLPGSLQYAIALEVPIPPEAQLGGLDVTQPSDVQFVEIPLEVDLPEFNLFLQGRSETELQGKQTESQTGVVRNTGTLDWARVQVQAVAVNQSGDIVAVGSTFVGRLTVGDQREFSVQWPKPSDAISNVIALPSTNIFEEENIIRALGDPSLLR